MLGSIYRLDFCSAAGVKFAEVTDFLSLQYTRTVNAPGLLEFTLDADHSAIASLELDSQILVYRKNDDMALDWTLDFPAFWRYSNYQYTTTGEVFTARCPGQMSLLARRIVAYASKYANRSQFTGAKGETIMNTLVSYNACAAATTGNGRKRNGAITGVSVEADGAAGNTIDWACPQENLLETLQKLADVAGGDFDLVRTAAATWEWRFYTGQLGTDRSATVIFAVERGNMADPSYTVDRLQEQTVCIVGGAGQDLQRTFEVRTGTDYAAANDIECFLNGTNAATTAALDAAGDAKLSETEQQKTLTFTVLQTPACFYGVHYTLGDLVTASYHGASATYKVNSVSVTLDAKGAETIDIGLEVE